MINMTVYTGRGDSGMTDLGDLSRVSKVSPRIEAYGTVDELNSLLGTITIPDYPDIESKIQSVQNKLHVIQASYANPDPDEATPSITSSDIELLETWIDTFDDELEPLTHFILPGGSDIGARLHHARAVCRRAERRAVALAEKEDIDEITVAYLNRLSDALFVWARVINARTEMPEEEPTY